MRLISAPRPQFVEQCSSCGSAFYYFGGAKAVSHNDQYNVDVNYQRYLECANEPSLNMRHNETLSRLRELLPGIRRPRLFDVGAGGGDFLSRARDNGFEVAGNEVSQPAINECRNRHGIDLVFGDDLRELANEDTGYDVVTMWCVIAHVDEPEELLRGARALLRPGGILFFSTPRYCSIDRAALLLRKLTADRYRRVFDRRINHFHRRQYSRKGMEALLIREGFSPISIEPTIGYGLRMREYLTSLGVADPVSKPAGKALEAAANRGLLPRNILTVYAHAS
ncbi:class I SAM-dependent methyltransferase [Mycolicibacterium austroafricanum]|uniref:class I SAM-dependent methyltransferase n=1 Tax=Mycolicibacterium austroafricanum TaxID=39687 RepID=UPI001ABFD11C|nr:class I SAM-dependent methyltransferase [Mycolicibacterium austroafricanum]QRZ08327.1 class I SAM-dependent methyltransferase [Mycolicibacterium austroafricanum]QZT69979.1 class I SAM-dependent methyltransferase [Mycolicibacterium austroafricanum]